MVSKKKPEPKDLLDAELLETEQLISRALFNEEVQALKRAREAITKGSGSGSGARGDPATTESIPRPVHESPAVSPPRIQDRERGESPSPGDRPVATVRKPVPSAAPMRSWIPVLVRIIAGLAAGLAALMLWASYLAAKGIYIDALRPLWSPVPSDDVKWILGILVVVVTLLIAFRSRRLKTWKLES